MRGCFVTGTDTGVGKTVLAAAIAAALHARGVRVAAFKPVVTGIDDPEPGRPADHELLGAVTGLAPAAVAPLRFGPEVVLVCGQRAQQLHRALRFVFPRREESVEFSRLSHLPPPVVDFRRSVRLRADLVKSG